VSGLGAVGHTHGGRTEERRQGRVYGPAAARSEGRPGGEVLAGSSRACEWVCGHEALSG
jgi:hypothetical protein